MRSLRQRLKKVLLLLGLQVVMCSIGVAPAAAQSTGPASQRPWRGLFESRRSTGRPTDVPTLDLFATLYGARDAVTVSGPGDRVIDPWVQQTGRHGGALIGLAYAKRGRRVNVFANGTSNHAYFPNVSDRVLNAFAGSVGFGAELGPRTTVALQQSAARLPVYGMLLAPTLSVFPERPSSDFAGSVAGFGDPLGGRMTGNWMDLGFAQAIQLAESYFSNTAIGLRHSLGTRTSLRAYGSYARGGVRAGGQPDLPWVNSNFWRVGAGVSRSIARDVSANLGYSYAELNYPDTVFARPRMKTHGLDAGITYSRPITLSRRTWLNINTGSAFSRMSNPATPTSPANDVWAGYLVARASLTHEIGRTWLARLTYSRDLQYLDGFLAPTLSQWLMGAVSGSLNRRVDTGVAMSYSNGRVGVFTTPGYRILSATAGIRVALARRAALFGQYVSHDYGFREDMLLLPNIPSRINRHGVRVGLNLWLPVLN